MDIDPASISAVWRAKNEKFLKDVKLLNDWRVRVSWGEKATVCQTLIIQQVRLHMKMPIWIVLLLSPTGCSSII